MTHRHHFDGQAQTRSLVNWQPELLQQTKGWVEKRPHPQTRLRAGWPQQGVRWGLCCTAQASLPFSVTAEVPQMVSCVVGLPSLGPGPSLTVGCLAPTVTLGVGHQFRVLGPGCSLVPGHPHPQVSVGHPRPSTKPLCCSSSPHGRRC